MATAALTQKRKHGDLDGPSDEQMAFAATIFLAVTRRRETEKMIIGDNLFLGLQMELAVDPAHVDRGPRWHGFRKLYGSLYQEHYARLRAEFPGELIYDVSTVAQDCAKHFALIRWISDHIDLFPTVPCKG